jgi:hypothetical protein
MCKIKGSTDNTQRTLAPQTLVRKWASSQVGVARNPFRLGNIMEEN